MTALLHRLESWLLVALLLLFRALPLDAASALGGWLGRAIGPRLSAHATARRNLAACFPDLAPQRQREILGGMWDNLGRVAAEFAHLPGRALTSRLTVHGAEHLPRPGEAVLFFSGHLGNWELAYPMAFDRGVPVALAYRHANNPHADAVVCRLRASHASAMFPKGQRGALKMLRALKDGQSLAMLVDQKMNDGMAVPFFGRPAMTAPAIAELSLRLDRPIIPARVVRTGGAHFEGYLYPPLVVEKTGDKEKDALAIMTRINQILEAWIRERPEQWFWVHNRWPRE